MSNPSKVIKGLLGAEESIAEFIQSGPSMGLSGYVRDRYRHRCDEFANLPGWARALSGVAGGSINRICSPFWDDRGFTGPVAEPPLTTGGQCPVAYQVFTTLTNCGGNNVGENLTGTFVGPFTYEIDSTSSPCSTPGQSWRPLQRLRLGDGSAILETGGSCCVGSRAYTFRFVRVDGAPDDCGDQPNPDPLRPGPNPPPNPGPLPGPEPTDNPDPENPIPIIPIPPFEDPVFGPQPITGPDESTPQPPQPPQPSGDGIPGEEDSVGESAAEIIGGDDGEEVDFGEPPMGKIWVGCLVEYSAGTNYGGIPGTGPQNTVFPTVIGNVSLRFASGRGESKPARSRWVEVTRPSTSLLVEGAFVQARLGVTANVYPISVTVCKEVSCL